MKSKIYKTLFVFNILYLVFGISGVNAQSTNSVDFHYDALGQRIAKIDSEGDNTYYISPNLEIVVSKDGVVKTRKNYYFNGKLASVREVISSKAKTSSCVTPSVEICDGRDNDCDGIVDEGLNCVPSLYNIHQDHLGSTTLITNDKGEAVSQQSYYPYGETRSQTSEVGSQISERQYTGQISDTDQTGLYYYNARYYNPQIAKFTQADSSNDQLNRYAYVNNNPINSTDPTGRQDCNPNTAGGNAYPPWHPCAWVLIGEELKGYWNKAQEMAVAWVNNPIEFNKNLGKAIVQTAPQVIVYAIVANSQLGPQAAEALDTTLCALAADPGLCMISAQASGPNVATKFDVDDVPGRAGFLQSSQLVEKEMDPTGKLMMVGREELFDQYGLRYANGLHDPNGITLRATGDFSQMNVTLHHEYLHEIYGRGVGQYQSLNEMVENEIWVRETMLGYKGYGSG